MGALTRIEWLVELTARAAQLAGILGPKWSMGVLVCALLIRAARADRANRTQTVNLLRAASVLLILLLVASG